MYTVDFVDDFGLNVQLVLSLYHRKLTTWVDFKVWLRSDRIGLIPLHSHAQRYIEGSAGCCDCFSSPLSAKKSLSKQFPWRKSWENPQSSFCVYIETVWNFNSVSLGLVTTKWMIFGLDVWWRSDNTDQYISHNSRAENHRGFSPLHLLLHLRCLHPFAVFQFVK